MMNYNEIHEKINGQVSGFVIFAFQNLVVGVMGLFLLNFLIAQWKKLERKKSGLFWHNVALFAVTWKIHSVSSVGGCIAECKEEYSHTEMENCICVELCYVKKKENLLQKQ